MTTLWQDVRYALRILAKNPGFTIVAVLALALGIGADTAIFSVVDSVILRPLPYTKPGELVILRERTQQWPTGMSVAYLNFLDWRAQNQVFSNLAAVQGNGFNLTGRGEAERVPGTNVSADLFPLLGVKAFMGRTFTAEEDRDGAKPAVILNYGYWERRFHKDPAILGQALDLDGVPHTVVGVMPQGFRYPPDNLRGEIFAPIGRDGGGLKNRGSHPGIQVLGRLKPGVGMPTALAAMNTIAARLAAAYPDSNRDHSIYMDTLHHHIVRNVQPVLLVVLVAVAFVLLIACTNAANLLLARAASRAHEISIRGALGASRSRIVRQMMTESLILGILGGTLGLLIALWGVRELVHYMPPNIPHMGDIGLDPRVLAFTMGLSVFTGLAFGVLPAVHISGHDPQDALREGGGKRATGDREKQRTRGILVVAEVALSLVLLTGAGLTMKSFHRLANTSPGLNPANALTMQIDLPSSKYSKEPQIINYTNEVERRVRDVPGVLHAGFITPLPLGGNDWEDGITWEGRPMRFATDYEVTDIAYVTPDYFAAMGVPITRGRAFTAHDTAEAARVAIIDESFAARAFPNQDPIGKRIRRGGKNIQWVQIVGVAGHVMNYGVDGDSRIETYIPHAQQPISFLSLVVRTAGDPSAMTAPIRRAIAGIDPNQPVFQVHTMDELLDQSIATKRASMLLLAAFAATALLLSAIGLYGVVSYSVTQRTREIGIRMALGAEKGDVLSMVVRQGGLLVVMGLATGLAASLALAQFLRGLLYGVSATDPTTFVLVSLILAAVAFFATLIPARRAARVDPMVALRYE